MNYHKNKSKGLLKKAFVLSVLVLTGLMVYHFIPRKDFPVKVGQTWKREMNVIPCENNRQLREMTVVYSEHVYNIDKDGRIFYVRNGFDSLDLSLEAFLYNSSLEK